MLRRLILSLSLALLFSALLEAQVRGSVAPATVQPSFGQPIGSPTRGLRGGFGEFHSPRPFRNHTLVLGGPYLYDYADYASEPVPSQLEPQAGIAPGIPASPAATPPEPLLLEWQGDRWVRVNPTAESGTAKSAADLRPSQQRAGHNAPENTPIPPPNAVLIFSDGHREEISRYMIVGGVMYANSDYWTTGTWTKKILLSSLDLPASLRANQERGAKLMLPGGPNEVVLGP